MVAFGEASLRFSNVLFDVGLQHCVNHLSQIRTRRPQCPPRGLSFSMLMACRVSPLVSHGICLAAAVSEVSHHSGLRGIRGVGGYLFLYCIQNSIYLQAIRPPQIFGSTAKKKQGSTERIRATARCLQSPPDQNFCRWKGHLVISVLTCLLVRNESRGGPSRIRYYGLHFPRLWAEAGGEPQHHIREVDSLGGLGCSQSVLSRCGC